MATLTEYLKTKTGLIEKLGTVSLAPRLDRILEMLPAVT